MPTLVQHAIAIGVRPLGRLRMRKFDSSPLCAQTATLNHLTENIARTRHGRICGITPAMPYDRFQQTVPIRAYEQFAPWIEEMKRGASDVLWPGTCSHYAVSSGTTAGRTKFLPITPDMLQHFRETGLNALLAFTRRVGTTDVFRGKHLFLGGSTTLTPIKESLPFEAVAGDLSGITAIHMPTWVDRTLYEPGAEIAQLSDWPAKIKAIATRTWNRDIRVVAGIPSWLLILAEELKSVARAHGVKVNNLRQLWPNLECLIHGGVPIAPYATELRSTFGEVTFHEVYPASEGFIAVQDSDATAGMRLMTSAGIFYEFLPFSEYDESNLEALRTKTVCLADVQLGVDYVLIMTTPAGLCRYVIGDVVRFTSLQPPRLIYVGRTKLQLSAFGEHVIEKEVTDALTCVCARHGVSAANFHVAPLFASQEEGRNRGRHEWWIELNAANAFEENRFADELDAELMRLNEDYEAKRAGGGLEPPVVRFVRPGVFRAWMELRGRWGGQNKMPRCRSDRSIADELATFAG